MASNENKKGFISSLKKYPSKKKDSARLNIVPNSIYSLTNEVKKEIKYIEIKKHYGKLMAEIVFSCNSRNELVKKEYEIAPKENNFSECGFFSRNSFYIFKIACEGSLKPFVGENK